MIDLHAHILPGLDDGVRSLAEALALAEASLQDGVEVIAATPHVRDDYPTSAGQMEAALTALRSELAERRVALDVLQGGEVALDYLDRLDADELERFTLGATGRYLLVEFPYYGWPLSLEHTIGRLARQGVIAVLAHPERNADVQAQPERLAPAVARGALVQLTAASLDGRLGRRVRRASGRLLELELAHLIASDAHAPEVRSGGMSSAAHALGDPGRARYLTFDVPAAIASGRPIPQRLNRSRES